METQGRARRGCKPATRKAWEHALPLLLLLLLFLFNGHCQAQTDPQDVAVLMVLQHEWSYNNPALSSWQGASDPCNLEQPWLGVSCNKTSHVQSLALPNMQLVGSLPADIGNLIHLKRLDLSFNANLTGPLPPELGNLVNLKALVLQWCGFSGSIPSELGKMRNLTYLELNGNYLSGPIPHELGLLSEIFWFDLSSNQLTGELPFSAKFGSGLDNFTKAQHFHLNNNSFEGVISGSIFHEKMKLVHVLLDANKLEGPIPAELGSLKQVTIIKLNNNKLSGEIPETLANISTLTDLELNRNSLIGTPPNLATLKKIKLLDLSDNIFSAMDVPSWFSNLSSLNSLFMSNANLHGKIPSDVLALPQLRIVNLSNNFINGSLDFPNNISKGLEYIYLNYNNITGTKQLTSYNKSNVLQLQGNPVCSSLASSYCPLPTPPMVVVNESDCTLTVCATPLTLNPGLCSCALPYVGIYIFRAPQFRALDNNTDFSDLTKAITIGLAVDIKQVMRDRAYFDNFQYLNIWYNFFPPIGSQRWTREQVYDLNYRLSSVDISNTTRPVYPVPIYGPSQFRPLPYPFPDERNSVLSRSAEIGIISGAVALGIIIVAVCVYAILQKKRADLARAKSKPFALWPDNSGVGETGGPPNLKGARYFSISEIKKATNNFSADNEIGVGGYGKVYRGFLLSGEQVAVKRAHEMSILGAGEFKTEIELLSRMHHKNLVGLIGFCYENGEQVLIYEYMAKGTLKENISGMEWERRVAVALGAARGISYLHEMANPPIIHRDIKSTNILMDEQNVAKVADFGIGNVRQAGDDAKAHFSTHVKGTMGYLDPEYYMTLQLTEKSNVYSFGVVLLEILTARNPIDEHKHIAREVKAAVENSENMITASHPFLDPTLHDAPLQDLNQFLNIALRCIQETGDARPSMTEVALELEALAEIYQQPKPLKTESAQHPYSTDSDIMKRADSIDSSFQYSGAYMVPAAIEPK